MGSLLEKFAGKIDLIYIDPPFDTGSDFSFKVLVGQDDDPVPGKESSLIEESAYRDTWGREYDSYLSMMDVRPSFNGAATHEPRKGTAAPTGAPSRV